MDEYWVLSLANAGVSHDKARLIIRTVHIQATRCIRCHNSLPCMAPHVLRPSGARRGCASPLGRLSYPCAGKPTGCRQMSNLNQFSSAELFAIYAARDLTLWRTTIGRIVKHISFGDGVVTAADGLNVYVKFGSDIKHFQETSFHNTERSKAKFLNLQLSHSERSHIISFLEECVRKYPGVTTREELCAAVIIELSTSRACQSRNRIRDNAARSRKVRGPNKPGKGYEPMSTTLLGAMRYARRYKK